MEDKEQMGMSQKVEFRPVLHRKKKICEDTSLRKKISCYWQKTQKTLQGKRETQEERLTGNCKDTIFCFQLYF